MEVGYVNKKHPDFNTKAVVESAQQSASNETVKNGLSEVELKNIRILEGLIFSYFYIIRKSIQDSVPKAIMFHLVNVIKASVGNELLSQLYQPGLVDELLRESEDVLLAREKATDMLDVRFT